MLFPILGQVAILVLILGLTHGGGRALESLADILPPLGLKTYRNRLDYEVFIIFNITLFC